MCQGASARPQITVFARLIAFHTCINVPEHLVGLNAVKYAYVATAVAVAVWKGIVVTPKCARDLKQALSHRGEQKRQKKPRLMHRYTRLRRM